MQNFLRQAGEPTEASAVVEIASDGGDAALAQGGPLFRPMR